jgi:hypothetical protein
VRMNDDLQESQDAKEPSTGHERGSEASNFELWRSERQI